MCGFYGVSVGLCERAYWTHAGPTGIWEARGYSDDDDDLAWDVFRCPGIRARNMPLPLRMDLGILAMSMAPRSHCGVLILRRSGAGGIGVAAGMATHGTSSSPGAARFVRQAANALLSSVQNRRLCRPPV